MPIFEYQCKDCGHITEELRTFVDRHETAECPHCETCTAEYLPSAPGGYHIGGNNSASQRPKQAFRPVKKREANDKS